MCICCGKSHTEHFWLGEGESFVLSVSEEYITNVFPPLGCLLLIFSAHAHSYFLWCLINCHYPAKYKWKEKRKHYVRMKGLLLPLDLLQTLRFVETFLFACPGHHLRDDSSLAMMVIWLISDLFPGTRGALYLWICAYSLTSTFTGLVTWPLAI